MTDEQIIKEFDLFLKYSAPEKLLNDVLDLINRQKAEIERFQKANEINISAIATLHEKIKILDDIQRKTESALPRYEKSIKAEAIKEFADRLKKLYETYPEDEEASALYLINKINEIVKEMKGNNDE